MRGTDTDTGNINVRGLPLDLRQAFKAHCALMGKSMSARLTELIRTDVAEHYHLFGEAHAYAEEQDQQDLEESNG